MSYRYYLGVIEKDKLDCLSEDEREMFYNIKNNLKVKLEFEMENKLKRKSLFNTEQYEELATCENNVLLDIANFYKSKVIKWYKKQEKLFTMLNNGEHLEEQEKIVTDANIKSIQIDLEILEKFDFSEKINNLGILPQTCEREMCKIIYLYNYLIKHNELQLLILGW